MELKHTFISLKPDGCVLLIVPYGIETSMRLALWGLSTAF